MLVVVELVLRASGRFAHYDAQPLQLPGQPKAAEPITRFDERLIYATVPGARTFPWYHIDSHGYRSPEFEDRKPPGTFRLIATGDSTTFGIAMGEDEHWTARLRQALTALCEGARDVEVIDAGVIGYSTLQNRLQIERDLLPLQPDLLVWMIGCANDARLVEGPGDAEQSR